MKRRILLLLALAGITTLAFLGCGSQSANLKLEDGVLSWDADKSADHYEVELNDISVTCKAEQADLLKLCEYEGNYKVTVSSISDSGKKKELGNLELSARTLNKPEISVAKSSGEKMSFMWKAQEDVSRYQYNLYDGMGVQEAEIGEDQTCKVDFDGEQETMITVVAKGSSKGTELLLDSEENYVFDGNTIFNMADLAKYPFTHTATGKSGGEYLVAATTLAKGVYDLEMSFYVMNTYGESLSGNGTWGRRLLDNKSNLWFCTDELEEWEGSGNTLPVANETITKKVNVNVDKYGEIKLELFNWLEKEMIVVADIKKDGKSVMAKGFKQHDPDDDVVFDIKKLDQFLAVYRGTGKWSADAAPGENELVIPTKLKDGIYQIEISYQLMNAEGGMLTGNGLWGRRITDESMTNIVWWCEDAIEGQTDGIEKMPRPDKTQKSTFQTVVENGKFKIQCLNFAEGEILAVSAIKKISGSSARFDISKLKKYNNVFVSAGSVPTGERFRVETTLYQRGQFELEVTYYAMDKDGRMLTGNGTWGRRMMDEGRDELWICATAPEEEHKDAENTIPEPDKPVTRKMTVTLNKKGRFYLYMYNFLEGETVVITDIKYQGKSIIVK